MHILELWLWVSMLEQLLFSSNHRLLSQLTDCNDEGWHWKVLRGQRRADKSTYFPGNCGAFGGTNHETKIVLSRGLRIFKNYSFHTRAISECKSLSASL
jgi:hypothetical protein